MNSVKNENLNQLILRELENNETINGFAIQKNLFDKYSIEISGVVIRQVIKELRKTHFIIGTTDGYQYFSQLAVSRSEKIRERVEKYLENRSKEIASEQIIVNSMKGNLNRLVENEKQPSLFDNGGRAM
ncbi:MAG: hypothetical protein LBE13_04425 [Bacteroidales bacterium]|jgi:hypothetical protein|nr:hypothetical protein [Bacteroidales bacterium]